MSYEEFLDLSVETINEFVKVIEFKVENDIPFSEEELVMRDHFIRYTKELRIEEQRHFLEYCYELPSD